jgi:hypothetical protein
MGGEGRRRAVMGAPLTGRRGEATRRDGHLHASRCKLRGAERGVPRTSHTMAASSSSSPREYFEHLRR